MVSWQQQQHCTAAPARNRHTVPASVLTGHSGCFPSHVSSGSGSYAPGLNRVSSPPPTEQAMMHSPLPQGQQLKASMDLSAARRAAMMVPTPMAQYRHGSASIHSSHGSLHAPPGPAAPLVAPTTPAARHSNGSLHAPPGPAASLVAPAAAAARHSNGSLHAPPGPPAPVVAPATPAAPSHIPPLRDFSVGSSNGQPTARTPLPVGHAGNDQPTARTPVPVKVHAAPHTPTPAPPSHIGIATLPTDEGISFVPPAFSPISGVHISSPSPLRSDAARTQRCTSPCGRSIQVAVASAETPVSKGGQGHFEEEHNTMRLKSTEEKVVDVRGIVGETRQKVEDVHESQNENTQLLNKILKKMEDAVDKRSLSSLKADLVENLNKVELEQHIRASQDTARDFTAQLAEKNRLLQEEEQKSIRLEAQLQNAIAERSEEHAKASRLEVQLQHAIVERTEALRSVAHKEVEHREAMNRLEAQLQQANQARDEALGRLEGKSGELRKVQSTVEAMREANCVAQAREAFEADVRKKDARILELQRKVEQHQQLVQSMKSENETLSALVEQKQMQMQSMKAELEAQSAGTTDIFVQQERVLADREAELQRREREFISTQRHASAKDVECSQRQVELEEFQAQLEQQRDVLMKESEEVQSRTRKLQNVEKENRRLMHNIEQQKKAIWSMEGKLQKERLVSNTLTPKEFIKMRKNYERENSLSRRFDEAISANASLTHEIARLRKFSEVVRRLGPQDLLERAYRETEELASDAAGQQPLTPPGEPAQEPAP